MDEFIFTYITCESQAQAEQIGTVLVEENLAACANVFPASTAIYKWQGQLQQSEEAIVLLKTRFEFFERIEARVKELHSYDVPCILSFPIMQGSEGFLQWVKNQTSV